VLRGRSIVGSWAGLHRASGAALRIVLITLVMGLLGGLVGCADDEAPVVARGRWVEIATHRDEPVCAGTVAHLDALIEAGFELLGATPPDRVFVRYEWFDPEDHPPLIPTGHAQRVDGEIHILSNRLVHEHELAHAVHLHAWPRSAQFMEEGLAVLLDPKRPLVQLQQWRTGVLLDDVLAARSLSPDDYYDAWFLVSQIVFDHGIEGLRDLWHAVPQRATANEVRDAYAELFDRPIEALIEPYSAGEIDGHEIWMERRTCSLALCPGEPKPWTGNVWTGAGPHACEGDPQAVGPETYGQSLGIGNVWRPYIIEFEGDAPDVIAPDTPYDSDRLYDWASTGLAGGLYEPCALYCDTISTGPGYPGQEAHDWRYYPGRLRVDVRHELDDLPRDPPGELHITRNNP
jgi:hypothetical protein